MPEAAPAPELFQSPSYASPTKECDVVMKGGITSGVVYPLAICELARDYRLRSVGGSSAGAIAAVAAAAAECGRQQGVGTGYVGLAQLPGKLGEQRAGRSRLFSLFQPNPETRGIFGILSAFLFRPPDETTSYMDECKEHLSSPWTLLKKTWGRCVRCAHRSKRGKIVPLTCAFVKAFPGWSITSVAPLFFVIALLKGLALNGAFPSGLGGLALGCCWVIALWMILFGLIVAFPIRKLILSTIEDNGYGLTTGFLPADKAPAQPLTSFLDEQFDALAGKQAGTPLTFGDLAEAGVSLEVLTTNLTQGRPHSIPFQTRDFHWDPTEFERYFPPAVVDWMVKHSEPVADDDEPAVVDGKLLPLRMLPETRDLPVVLAARMSLSFPVLISAVPLYAKRYTKGFDGWERCQFSDGGISSNLPVHFFDSPVPTRPTFAINLRGTSKVDADPCKNVRLPKGKAANLGGIRPRSVKIEGVPAFLGAVMNTMQNWADDLQLRVPGYRDRVATIYHDASEGGLNLDMPQKRIEGLSERGLCAGEAFVRDFDWENHRWVRFRSSMHLLQGMTGGIGASIGDDITEMIETPPSYPIANKKQKTVAERVVEKVADVGALNTHQDNPFGEEHDDQAPKPLPRLQIVPRT
ncbi:MAG: hypothetical protein GY711_26900 [bacterium]|nr:hypothetical protein [bacterium]